MKYKIVITKIEEKAVSKQGQWTIIDARPWTADELDNTDFSGYGNIKKFLDEKPLKQIYGYTPNFQVVEPTETEVLQQTVETLDMAAVIKAINGL